MERGGCVYIMTNKTHQVLYTGVTTQLYSRVIEHKNHIYPDSFTSKYNCTKLVYYLFLPHIEEAIIKEKQMKKWKREYKLNVINELNPDWIDLTDKIIDC